MVPVADRYCGNCGQTLNLEDRFCPSCGKPIQETATVPTPEADVSVPTPPHQQAGGTPNFAPAGGSSPPRSGGVRRFFVGYAGVLVVLILIIIILAAIGGGGGDSSAPQQQEDNASSEEKAANEPAPKEEAAPKPPPEPDPIELSGTGSQATDFFELEQGLMVVDMAHQGQSNFVVTLLNEQGQEVAFALGNAIGTVEVSNATRIPKTGRYILDVESDGPWQITVRQPRPAEVPEQTSFSGEGGAATELFAMSGGLKKMNFTHQGESNFVVTLLDQEGREVEFALANDIGNVETSSTATIGQDGIYLFTVEADGPWTINIQ